MTDAERADLFERIDVFLRLCWQISARATGKCPLCGRSELHLHAVPGA